MNERENLVLISIVKQGITFHGREGIECTLNFKGKDISLTASYPPSTKIQESNTGEFYLEDFFDPVRIETIRAYRNEARDGRYCKIKEINVKTITCHFCAYGHMTNCHYPLECSEANCDHADPEYVDQEFEPS